MLFPCRCYRDAECDYQEPEKYEFARYADFLV